MKLDDFELRTPAKGEVAVKVNFAAINPIDWKVRNGNLKMVTRKKFPRRRASSFARFLTSNSSPSSAPRGRTYWMVLLRLLVMDSLGY